MAYLLKTDQTFGAIFGTQNWAHIDCYWGLLMTKVYCSKKYVYEEARQFIKNFQVVFFSRAIVPFHTTPTNLQEIAQQFN